MPQKFTRNFVSPQPEPSEIEALDTTKRTVVVELSPSVLVDGVGQTRTDYIQETLEEFADSVKAEGIIEPLIVERLPDGKFGILAGHRRKRAAVLAGLPTVPCIVHAPFKSDKDRVIFGIIENVIREDISPLDKANAYKRLIDEGMTQSEIARRIGVKQSSVSRALQLLELPETIQDAVLERTITPKKLRVVMPHMDKPGVADAVMESIRNGDTSEKRMTEIVRSVTKTETVTVAPVSENGKALRMMTRDELAMTSVREWLEMYPPSSYTVDHPKRIIGEKLLSMPATATADDVDVAVGSKSWTRLTCHVCREDKIKIVVIETPVDGEIDVNHICETCARSIVAMFDNDKNERELI